MVIDGLDKAILTRLRADARTPFLKIAKQLSVSEGTVRNRVEKMLKQRVLKRFTIELGSDGGVTGIIAVKTEPGKRSPAIGNALAKMHGVSTAFEVSGEFDVFCIAESSSLSDLNSLIDRIRAVHGVRDTQTFMVMEKIV